MTHDFLIVGGGIAGVSAASQLAAVGSVLMIETEDHLAFHASGRSAALYEPHYGPAPVVALSEASGAALRAADVLSPRGLLLLGGADDKDEFEAEEKSFGMERISPAEARAIVPILSERAVVRAAFADHAWDIDTDRLVQSFARTARDQGAEIVTGAAATAIRRDAGVWTVTTRKGEMRARTLVNAAGAWVDEVAKMAGVRPLGFTPLRRSMARIAAPGGHDVSTWPMMFGAGEAWYAKPDAGALIVSPAEEDPAAPHDAWADDMVLAEGLARYEEMVTAPVERLLASWAGLRTFAPDRLPVIGRDPTMPDFVWFAGQGGYGFQSAPANAALLADLLGGRPVGVAANIAEAVSANRFR
ncbi:MAG TPA: FAD-dependent oxidoreductase [Albidovulum sp.]|uniref:NAD(P)/FAD-dependent oxidoreductase n=1 Tax=Albidovulum sp. TaxID=1872424 RepID=UPI002CBB9B49|nr:FAD-dependent oxidoreductase [Albidovulum sp.]